MDDIELLGRYAQEQDQQAFSTLVERHEAWVYAAARRQVRDEHAAEDVAQAVFAMLARRAGKLKGYLYLSGWLFRALSYCVGEVERERLRRKRREAEAARLRGEVTNMEADWEQIAPELDAAVGTLGKKDRDAVVLRFCEQRPLAEVGLCLGISEKAAQKRVERAVGKLREKLAGKGVEVEAGSLGAMVLAHAVEGGMEGGAAGLVEKVMAGIGDGGGNGTAELIAKGAMKMMVMAKVKVVAVAAIGLTLAGAAVYAQSRNAMLGGTSVQQPPPQQAATNPAKERLLSFPAGVTLGALYLRDDRPHDTGGQDWKYLAPAAGQVRIPAGKQVELRVSGGAVGQLASLEALPVDSVYRVSLDNTAADDAAVAAVLPLKGLKSLSLGQARITDQVAATIAGLAQLEDLELTNTAAGPSCLAAIGSLRNLRSLELWGTRITDAGLQQLAGMNELQLLDLGRTHISDEGIVLLGNLPKLRWLRLGNGEIKGADQAGVTDRATNQIAKWTSLESLDMQDTSITDRGITALSRLPHLKELRIAYTRVTDAGMVDIAAISTLEKLQLPDGITANGLVSLGDHPSLKQIDGISGLDDQALAILAHLPALEAIELSGPRITDAGMDSVGRMRSLRRLALYECAVGDDGFAKLAPLQSLEQLSLAGTHITPRGLVALKELRHLTFLRLGDSALVHGGLKNVAGMESLRTLCLQGNGLALDDTVLADVGQLPGLQELIVQNWDAPHASISDAGVSHLTKLTKLQQLMLDTPGTLTDRSLVSLSGLRELGFLRLHGRFTDDGLRALEGIPLLSSLVLPGKFSDEAMARLRERAASLQGFIILDK